MPKLKTRKAASKRYKLTGKDNFLRHKAFKGHLLMKKSNKQKRKLSQRILEIENSDKFSEFEAFLDAEYSSKPGFISTMPNSIDNVKDEINSGDLVNASCGLLSYLLNNEELLDSSDLSDENSFINFVRNKISNGDSNIFDFLNTNNKNFQAFNDKYEKYLEFNK